MADKTLGNNQRPDGGKNKQPSAREQASSAMASMAYAYRNGDRTRLLIYPSLRTSRDTAESSEAEQEPEPSLSVTRRSQDTGNLPSPGYRSSSPGPWWGRQGADGPSGQQLASGARRIGESRHNLSSTSLDLGFRFPLLPFTLASNAASRPTRPLPATHSSFIEGLPVFSIDPEDRLSSPSLGPESSHRSEPFTLTTNVASMSTLQLPGTRSLQDASASTLIPEETQQRLDVEEQAEPQIEQTEAQEGQTQERPEQPKDADVPISSKRHGVPASPGLPGMHLSLEVVQTANIQTQAISDGSSVLATNSSLWSRSMLTYAYKP